MNKIIKLALIVILVMITVGLFISESQPSYENIIARVNPFTHTEVPLNISDADCNQNNSPDALDVVSAARTEVERQTIYDASYVNGGYPEEGKGACTDVIWRALQPVNIDLKQEVDEDIKSNPELYGSTGENPDSNIDFRRVRNLSIYFKRHSEVLTTEVKPGDPDNLVNWQPGDIVVFGPPLEHIAVISDQRRRDGVPLIIHNAGPSAKENDRLLSWPTEIRYHFRVIE